MQNESTKKVIVIAEDIEFPCGTQLYGIKLIEAILEIGYKIIILTRKKPAESFTLCGVDEIEWLECPGFFQFGNGIRGRIRKIRDERRLHVIARSCVSAVLVIADRPRTIYTLIPRDVKVALWLHEVGPTCPGSQPCRYLRESQRACSRPPGFGCLQISIQERCLGARPLVRKLLSIGRSVWARRVVRSTQIVIANSSYTASMYGSPGGKFFPRLVYPPLGIVDPDQNVEISRLPEHRFRLVFIGRVEVEKGIIEALEMLTKLPSSYSLSVVGTGSAIITAVNRASALGLGERVEFKGWKDPSSVARELRMAGVALVPSLCAEGYAMVGPEAMYFGTPVVAYETGGIPEWCDGTTAICVPVGDRNAAVEKILQITHDEFVWKRICALASARGKSISILTNVLGPIRDILTISKV